MQIIIVYTDYVSGGGNGLVIGVLVGVVLAVVVLVVLILAMILFIR